MLFFAARAELIIVLGFADQRLVPWGRNCFRNNKLPRSSKVRLFHIPISLGAKGLSLGNQLFKKRMARAGVSIHWLVLLRPAAREARTSTTHTNYNNLPTPGSYPRKGKADSASTSHDKEVLGGQTIGILDASRKIQFSSCHVANC